MILKSLETIRLRASDKTTYVFVRLHTDDGRSGLGDGSMSHADRQMVQKAVELFDRALAGQPVEAIGRLVEALREHVGRWPSIPVASAISALEQALWDLRGQQLGVPIHALIGGARRERIRLYANINRGIADRSPAGFAERARAAVAEGFGALKCAPFDGVDVDRLAEPPVRASVALGIQRVEAVRAAIGPAVELMVDCHSRFSPEVAVEVAERLASTGLRWFEEPVPMHTTYPRRTAGVLETSLAPDEGGPPELNLAGLRVVAERSPFPLAGGEYFYGVEPFAKLMASGTVRTIMPDVKHCGGIWELVRIAAVADSCGVAVAPHNPTSAVATLASVHLGAALTSFDLLEFQWGELDWRAELIEPAERLEDGYLRVPDAPGLGARLNEGVVERYRVPC